MTTYTCKCGKTFGKNTEAGTTGLRMPDYGAEHECYGCPFVCKVMTWDRTQQDSAIANHECRGSKGIRYDSTAALSLGDKCVGRIYSLDFDFLHRVREYADTLDGIEPDRYAFSSRPADYCDDGRYRLTIYPAANNKGVVAKQQLFDEFFHPDGTRKNYCPEEEKEIVLRQIQDGKREAQHTMTQYLHAEKVYFVKESDDGKFRVYFYYLANPPVHTPVGGILPAATLTGSRRRCWTIMRSGASLRFTIRIPPATFRKTAAILFRFLMTPRNRNRRMKHLNL